MKYLEELRAMVNTRVTVQIGEPDCLDGELVAELTGVLREDSDRGFVLDLPSGVGRVGFYESNCVGIFRPEIADPVIRLSRAVGEDQNAI